MNARIFHELTPMLAFPTRIGVVECWPDRTPPLLLRNGESITPISVEAAQEVMRALGDAIKMVKP